MRILIGAESFIPRSNGVTNSVARTIRFLTAAGHQVLIVAPGDGPTDFEGLPVIRIPAISLKSWATVDISAVTVGRLIKIISEFKPDVIHLASPFLLGAQIRKAANRLDVPTVAVYQTDVSGFASFYGLSVAKNIGDARIYRIHRKADLTLSPSTDSTHYLEGLGIQRIRHWGRGVDLEQFNPAWRSNDLRKSWGADRETCVIGFVGRLAPEKQVEKLCALAGLDYLSEVKSRIVIVGSGPSAEKIAEKLTDAHFTGQLHGDELSRAIASFDILVTTGENETFCQVVQEGMAARVPVVAPKSGGPIDLITHGVDGFLYEPGDVFSLRKYVLKLMRDKELSEYIAQSGYEKVQTRTWTEVCGELLGHYQEAIFNRENREVS